MDLDAYADSLLQNLPPEPWTPWPGGWPHDIELALLDSVFSIRARYGRPGGVGHESTGVHAVLEVWRSFRSGGPCDDLSVLCSYRRSSAELATVLGN